MFRELNAPAKSSDGKITQGSKIFFLPYNDFVALFIYLQVEMLYKGFLCDCMEVFMGCFLSLAHANPIWAGYVAQLSVFVFFFFV